MDRMDPTPTHRTGMAAVLEELQRLQLDDPEEAKQDAMDTTADGESTAGARSCSEEFQRVRTIIQTALGDSRPPSTSSSSRPISASRALGFGQSYPPPTPPPSLTGSPMPAPLAPPPPPAISLAVTTTKATVFADYGLSHEVISHNLDFLKRYQENDGRLWVGPDGRLSKDEYCWGVNMFMWLTKLDALVRKASGQSRKAAALTIEATIKATEQWLVQHPNPTSKVNLDRRREWEGKLPDAEGGFGRVDDYYKGQLKEVSPSIAARLSKEPAVADTGANSGSLLQAIAAQRAMLQKVGSSPRSKRKSNPIPIPSPTAVAASSTASPRVGSPSSPRVTLGQLKNLQLRQTSSPVSSPVSSPAPPPPPWAGNLRLRRTGRLEALKEEEREPDWKAAQREAQEAQDDLRQSIDVFGKPDPDDFEGCGWGEGEDDDSGDHLSTMALSPEAEAQLQLQAARMQIAQEEAARRRQEAMTAATSGNGDSEELSSSPGSLPGDLESALREKLQRRRDAMEGLTG